MGWSGTDAPPAQAPRWAGPRPASSWVEGLASHHAQVDPRSAMSFRPEYQQTNQCAQISRQDWGAGIGIACLQRF